MASIEKSTYYRVSAALMLLLALTFGMHFVPLGPFSAVVALAIAFAKMALIVLFFMHVRYGSALTKLFAAAGIFWLVIMFVLTFGDYATRPEQRPTSYGLASTGAQIQRHASSTADRSK